MINDYRWDREHVQFDRPTATLRDVCPNELPGGGRCLGISHIVISSRVWICLGPFHNGKTAVRGVLDFDILPMAINILLLPQAVSVRRVWSGQ